MSIHLSAASSSGSSAVSVEHLHPRFLFCNQLLSEVSAQSHESSSSSHSGSGSEVFRVTQATSGSKFVVKRTSKSSLHHHDRGRKKQLQRIDTERRILERLSQQHKHKNESSTTPLLRFTPELHAAFESSAAFYHVLEDCNSPLRNLEHLLQLQGRLSEDMSRSLIHRLCQAVSWLHQCGVIHRDLKPSNLVFDADHQLRVIDFGLSASVQKPENGDTQEITSSAEPDGSSTPNDSAALFSVASAMRLSAVGSVAYLSPELILGVGHDYRVDLWSMGVIIFQILCGYQPFQGASEQHIMDAIIDSEISWPESCSSLVKQVQQLHEKEEWSKQLEQLQSEYKESVSRDPASTTSPLSPAAISLILRLLQIEPADRIGQRGQEEALLQHLFFNVVEVEQSQKMWTEMVQEQAKQIEKDCSLPSNDDDRIGKSVELLHEASVSSSSLIPTSETFMCSGFHPLQDPVSTPESP